MMDLNFAAEFLKSNFLYLLLIMIVSYLMGSVNFSILVTPAFKKETDIRDLGSGNAGFTNVLRSVGIFASALTALGDFLKGAFAVLFAKTIFWLMPFRVESTNASMLNYVCFFAALCCVLGHVYPIYFKFKGGKAVLTAFSCFLFIDLKLTLLSFAVFLLVLLVGRIISLSSITAAIFLPIINFIIHVNFTRGDYYAVGSTLFCLCFTLLIVLKHNSNIKRLLKGTESKLTFYSKKAKTN